MVALACVTCLCGLLWSAPPTLDTRALQPEYNLLSNCSFEAADAEGRPEGWRIVGQGISATVSTDEPLLGPHCLLLTATPGAGEDEATGTMPAAGAGLGAGLRQFQRAKEGVEYVLSAWVRVGPDAEGTPAVALEFRDSSRQVLWSQETEVQASTAPGQWTEVHLRATAPLTTAALAVTLEPAGSGDTYFDAVSLDLADGKPLHRKGHVVKDLAVAYAQPTWLMLRWQGDAVSYVVQWRKFEGGGEWREATRVPGPVYTIINLAPNTEYAVRVRTYQRAYYDLDGRRRDLTGQATAGPVTGTTEPLQPRLWAGFKLWPAVHLDTFPGGVTGSAVEAVGDYFYACEVRDDALYLSKVVPGSLKVEWTRVLVDHQEGVRLGRPDICSLGGRLWIVWDRRPPLGFGRPGRHGPGRRGRPGRPARGGAAAPGPARRPAASGAATHVAPPLQATASAAGAPPTASTPVGPAAGASAPAAKGPASLPGATGAAGAAPGPATPPASTPPPPARVCLMSYDLAADLASPVVEVPPSSPELVTAGGSITAYHGALWLTWVEEDRTVADPQARIMLATYDPTAGLGKPIPFADCPVRRPRAPTLAPLDGDLALMYTSGPSPSADQTYEPLMWATYDGERFGGFRTLSSFGLNRRPRGVDLNPLFLLTCESRTAISQPDSLASDIALTRLGPGVGDITTIYYAQDLKMNTGPDVTIYKGDIYVSYTKFEPIAGPSGRPIRSYGTYLGRVEPLVKGGP